MSFSVRAVATNGPPWVLHDRGEKRLMLLSHGPGRDHLTLSYLPTTEGGAPLTTRNNPEASSVKAAEAR